MFVILQYFNDILLSKWRIIEIRKSGLNTKIPVKNFAFGFFQLIPQQKKECDNDY